MSFASSTTTARYGRTSPHPRGAERIAACRADNRKVPQVVFKPGWNRDGRAAPFKRNDRLLEALPIGVVVFPGSGISANLADKAKQLGIPVWRFDRPAKTDGAAEAPFSPSLVIADGGRSRRVFFADLADLTRASRPEMEVIDCDLQSGLCSLKSAHPGYHIRCLLFVIMGP
jgi:hypothetical protein